MNFLLRKKTVIYSLIGVVVYLVWLLATIPANFVFTRYLSAGIPLGIKMTTPSGTLWSGKSGEVSIKQVNLGSASWELSALPLLWGNANLNVATRRNGAFISTQASLGTKRISLSGTEIDFPLSDLMPLLYGLPLSFDGKLKAHLKDVNIEPVKQIAINGRAVLTDVRLVAPQTLSLGDFSMVFEVEGNGTRITINDNQGPVAVNAVVNVEGSGSYTLKSTFVAQSSADGSIRNALVMLGKADSQGRYSFNYKGILPIKF